MFWRRFFPFHNKWFKLGALGTVCFVVVLLLIIFSTGFFDRSLPRRCAGESCLSLDNVSVSRQEFVIGDSSFLPETSSKILLKKDTGLSLTLLNNGKKIHRILQLVKEDGAEYKVYQEFFVKPKQKISLIGVLNYAKDSVQGPYIVFGGSSGGLLLVPQANVNEYLISCTTCTGEKSQIKIVLEK